MSHTKRSLDRDMRDANYPVDYGSYDGLTSVGKKLVELGLQNIHVRHLLDPDSKDSDWKTFRDADPSPFVSIHTGQGSSSLPKRWLDLKQGDLGL